MAAAMLVYEVKHLCSNTTPVMEGVPWHPPIPDALFETVPTTSAIVVTQSSLNKDTHVFYAPMSLTWCQKSQSFSVESSKMPKFPPPDNLNFSRPTEWPEWRRRFERYRIATKLDKDTGVVQVNTLVYVMIPAADHNF